MSFNSDKSIIRYALFILGVAMAAFVGTMAVILLTGTLLK